MLSRAQWYRDQAALALRDPLSHAYLAVRREIPHDELRQEIEVLRAQLARGRPQ